MDRRRFFKSLGVLAAVPFVHWFLPKDGPAKAFFHARYSTGWADWKGVYGSCDNRSCADLSYESIEKAIKKFEEMVSPRGALMRESRIK